MPREYPSCPLLGIGVVVLKGEEVLLVKRGTEPSFGKWSIPGGLVELGEEIRAAAKREIREECGIEIELGEVVKILERIIRDERDLVKYHYVLIDFVANFKSGKLKASSDVLDAQWVPSDKLDSFEIPELTRQVIKEALSKVRLSSKRGESTVEEVKNG